MTMFEQAEEEGLLERYIPSWDTCVAPAAKSSQGFWYGTFFTPEVILYNTTMLQASDMPKDWDDLLAPARKGKILIRAPLASGTMRIVFSAIIERERERSGTTDAGFQWLKRLDANTKAYVSDPSQLYIRIARGEAPLSIWNLPDIAMEASRAGYPFAYVLPASGSPMITDGIALVKGGKHMDAARVFYEFVTTTESMLLQSRAFYRIPARRDIPADSLPSWLAGRVWTPMKIDWRSIAQHEGEWMKQWEEEVKGNGATADQGTH